ncbi:MAG: CpaF family protein [Pararhodobacter sp.]|nr:CpaF family protein [Pararhodobacter sp.]
MFGKKPADSKKPNQGAEQGAKRTDAKLERQASYRAGFDGASFEPEMNEGFREIKHRAFTRLIDVIDAAMVLRMDIADGRAHIARLLNEILISERIQVSAAEESRLLNEIADDMLGFGPLERFLTRDDISDIMVNGTEPIYVEVGGLVKRTETRFSDNAQLLNVCQRIVSLVGRRVDEASPICDARLQDGSRVNVIIPPISLNGPALTIRRFQAERLTINQLVTIGTISAAGAELVRIIARTRCNVLIVGGTGSGKTTLLNIMTGFIDHNERIVTCEDTAELQLQQPHVVRLETRPPNIEGKGEITMRELVRNCLRMRPDRIIVGEVRGPEAFDLLQAMNTGHDGSLGTLHANSPTEAITRMTSLVTMGYGSLQNDVIERMFASSIDIIIQIDRLRDGSRRITQITEVVDAGGSEIQLRDIMVFDIDIDQAAEGLRVKGEHRMLNPPEGQLRMRAAYYGEREQLERVIGKALD